MARTTAGLPAGSRITDFISLGVLAKTFPAAKVQEVLASCGKSGVRRRDLPAHVVVYYVIALGLYMNCSCRGSTLDVADEPANDEAFGRPGASRGDI